MTELISECQTALLSLPRGFAIIDLEGVIQAVNPILADQAVELGLSPLWGSVGFNVLHHLQNDPVPLKDRPEAFKRLHHLFVSVLKGQSEFHALEFSIYSSSRRCLALEISPYIQSHSPAIEGLLLTLTDITAYKELEISLQSALSEVKTLRGLLPICAVCKKIKDDQDHWTLIEDYLVRHTHAEFTHDICPDCIRQLYPQYSSSLQLADHSKENLEGCPHRGNKTKEVDC